MDRIALGAQLAAMRKARGLTLRAAATLIGVSHGYIDAVERGRPNANITLDTLERMANGLGGRLSVSVSGGPVEVFGALDSGELGRAAVIARALVAARGDPHLAIVVDAALDMIERRLASSASTGG